jgi:hypothetical protein
MTLVAVCVRVCVSRGITRASHPSEVSCLNSEFAFALISVESARAHDMCECRSSCDAFYACDAVLAGVESQLKQMADVGAALRTAGITDVEAATEMRRMLTFTSVTLDATKTYTTEELLFLFLEARHERVEMGQVGGERRIAPMT